MRSPPDSLLQYQNQTPLETLADDFEVALDSVKYHPSISDSSTPFRSDSPLSSPPTPREPGASQSPQFSPSLGSQPGSATFFSRRPSMPSSPSQSCLKSDTDDASEIYEADMGARLPSRTQGLRTEPRFSQSSFFDGQQDIAVQHHNLVQSGLKKVEIGDNAEQCPSNNNGISTDSPCSEEKHQGYWSALPPAEGESRYLKNSNHLRQHLETDRLTTECDLSRPAGRGGLTRQNDHSCLDRLEQSRQAGQAHSNAKASLDRRLLSTLRSNLESKSLYQEVVETDTFNYNDMVQESGPTSSFTEDTPKEVGDVDSHQSLQPWGFEAKRIESVSNLEPRGSVVQSLQTTRIADDLFPRTSDAQSETFERSFPLADSEALLSPDLIQPSVHSIQTPILDQYAWSPCASDDGTDQNIDRLADPDLRRLPPSVTDKPRLVISKSAIASNSHVSKEHPSKGSHFLSNEKVEGISGFLSDGSSSRPMSEKELHQSLHEFVRHNLRASTSSASFTPTKSDCTASSSRDFFLRIQNARPEYAEDMAGQFGPGSSQTTSSRPAEKPLTENSGSRGGADSHETSSSSRFRSPTPPLLFRKNLSNLTVELLSSSRPSNSSIENRFAKAIYARDLTNDSYRSGRIADSGDLDWVTETDIKTAAFISGEACEELSTSSLADISDSGNLSPVEGSSSGFWDRQGSLHYFPHARYNQSWTLQKNVRTGELALVPDRISREGHHSLNMNAITSLGVATNPGVAPDYRHPAPFDRGHLHPLSCSPPLLAPLRYSPGAKENGYSAGEQECVDSSSLESQMSEGTAGLGYVGPTRTNLEKVGSVSGAHEAGLTGMQKELGAKQIKSPLSSTWLSTVDEDQSNEPSLPLRAGILKISNFSGSRGNLTGTCDGVGTREVGSSLADGSSPGVLLSSSPAPFKNSPTTKLYRDWDDYSDALSIRSLSDHPRSAQTQSQNLVKDQSELRPHETAINMPPLLRKGTALGKPLQLKVTPSCDTIAYPESRRKWTKACLYYLPPLGSSKKASAKLSRQRRSSSENVYVTVISPPIAKVYALQSPIASRQKRRSAAGLLTAQNFSSIEDIESGIPRSATPVPEGCQKPQNNAESVPCRSIFSSQPRTDTTDMPTLLQTRSIFDFLPLLNRRGSRFKLPPVGDVGRAVSNPSIQPYSTEDEPPVAHTEDPRLYRMPRPASPELVRYHKHLSRMYILPCFVPFLGILYGHGILDCVIVWHTKGKIEHFRKQEKIFILVWSYSVMIFLLAGLIIATILYGV